MTKAVATLFALLLAVPLAFAQMQPGQTGRIRVDIPVLSGRAVKHIQVILRNENGWMALPVEQDGNWEPVEFGGLAVGSYEVVVTADGYEPVRWPVALGDMTRLVNASVMLKEKEKFGDVPSADKFPKKAVQDYEKAVDESRKGNTDRALKLLVSVIELAPDYYSAHNTLGTVYQKLNRYRDAEKEYKRAGELSPKSDEPLLNLGALYIQEADARASESPADAGKLVGQAREFLEQALKIKRSAMAYYLLGTAQYRTSAFEQSEMNLNQALEIEPRMPAARLMLANLNMRQQKWAAALSHLDAYLTENPKAADRAQIQETRARVAQRIK